MKSDVLQYEKIYGILKNKIECGLLPRGSKLPSRIQLSKEFHTSERTIRRVIGMLSRDGLVAIAPKKRPTVATRPAVLREEIAIQKINTTAADDIVKTGILLCYPINRRGMMLCTGDEWKIPETILENMNPACPTEFWHLSNRLWHFFHSRNGNELILRAVDSLGLEELDPMPGTLAIRQEYLASLKLLIATLKRGGKPENIRFDDLYPLYSVLLAQQDNLQAYRVREDSPLRVGTKGLEQELRKAQERYSSVYLDLMGLIAIGHFQLGDRLPSHGELQKFYGVSVDTTVKAVRILQEWGVVTAVRGKGIFVAMDQDGLQKIQIAPSLIASHVRRHLDSLELLSCTIEGVAAHAAAYATPEEAHQLYDAMESQINKPYGHQLVPRLLLRFITEHINYEALRSIYELLLQNYRLGRSIPKLISREKTPIYCEVYQCCLEGADCLMRGDEVAFAQQAAAVVQTIYQLMEEGCKKLGYWEAAMQVYDSEALWK